VIEEVFRNSFNLCVVPARPTTDSDGLYSIQHRDLSTYNRERLLPGLGDLLPDGTIAHNDAMLRVERDFVDRARKEIAPLIEEVPEEAGPFIRWFEELKRIGPGQGDRLFPWLAEQATYSQMRWFLAQEVAGEAGFDDLVAMTQVKMPARPKLEMARNYWDEMGRGDPKGMHGPMLEELAHHLGIVADIETTVPEALALGNMMMALASNRLFAFHSVGALGVIEMTAPERAAYVCRGLNRLGVPKKHSHYFALHSVLDVKHSQAWNAEVLGPLVEEDSRRARAIAEGAVLRLWCGGRCFDRYRQELLVAGEAVRPPEGH